MELSELCAELKNWFSRAVYLHTYIVQDGSIQVADGSYGIQDILQDGQYFRIVGSVFNDGVYQYPTTDLIDEEFDGAIWAMSVPKDVLNLKGEIEAWIAQYGEKANSPFVSESFGGYSYSKGGNSRSGESTSTSWRSAFSSRLNKWRKI